MHHDHDHHCGCGHHHDHHHDHDHHHCDHHHDHDHSCNCGGNCACHHTPLDELLALMQYMVSHNASHARELAELARQLQDAGHPESYEQVMHAVSDFEKGNLRLSAVLAGLKGKE